MTIFFIIVFILISIIIIFWVIGYFAIKLQEKQNRSIDKILFHQWSIERAMKRTEAYKKININKKKGRK